MPHPARLLTLAALFGAVTLAASPASAAFSFAVASDTGTQSTTQVSPSFQIITTPTGPLYTTNGAPTVINAGTIIFDFTPGLSSTFKAVANGTAVIDQSTDGRLVLDIHFDTPTSIVVKLTEGGVYSKTGNGSVSVSGGEFVVEAVNPMFTESHASSLNVNFVNDTMWTASATTAPFTGLFTDYRIIVDNDLQASATSGTASIQKNTFTLEINPPIPEPASLSLLGVGSAGLLLRRRRA